MPRTRHIHPFSGSTDRSTGSDSDSGRRATSGAKHDSAFDAYEILGVARSASADAIQSAYRARMNEYHPDKVAHLGEALQKLAHEKSQEIQRAYSQLRRRAEQWTRVACYVLQRENAVSELKLVPTDATFGAIATGVSLAELSDSAWKEVEAAFHEYALLVFPGQQLTSEQQVEFGRRFGEIEHLFGDAGIIPISNQRPDGSLLGEGEPGMEIMRGNEGWHTDSSYMPVSARASVFSAHVVPKSGGQTEWADMRAAYEALDSAMRQRIGELSAYHSLRYSQAKLGDTSEFGYGYHDGPIPLRPLVKIHSATGRPSLFIGRHAYGIPGLSESESEKLLDELMAFACQAPRTYQHEWQPGDLVVWDNRCLLHRARPYDHSEPRVMKHTRIAGDAVTESA